MIGPGISAVAESAPTGIWSGSFEPPGLDVNSVGRGSIERDCRPSVRAAGQKDEFQPGSVWGIADLVNEKVRIEEGFDDL